MNVIDISDFLDLKLLKRENLLDPWLPAQGLAMLYGARGLGKTYVATNIAAAIVAGTSFLGWHAPNPRGVMYIDGEMPASMMQHRLKQIFEHAAAEPRASFKIITPDLQSGNMPDLSTSRGQKLIEPHLDTISLIIVDNISTLCGRNENLTTSWKPLQEWALSLRSRGFSILFVHHSGKNGLQRGASSREDALDTVIHLKHPSDYSHTEGARFQVFFHKARGLFGDCVRPFEARLVTHKDGKQEWITSAVEES